MISEFISCKTNTVAFHIKNFPKVYEASGLLSYSDFLRKEGFTSIKFTCKRSRKNVNVTNETTHSMSAKDYTMFVLKWS